MAFVQRIVTVGAAAVLTGALGAGFIWSQRKMGGGGASSQTGILQQNMEAQRRLKEGGNSSNTSGVSSLTSHLVYDALAPSYDDKVGWDETLMGMTYLRSRLIAHARGNVLELAGGTGRNLHLYIPQKVAAVRVTELSKAMLKTAMEKAVNMQQKDKKPLLIRYLAEGEGNGADAADSKVAVQRRADEKRAGEGSATTLLEFQCADSHRLPYPDNSFDSIVDTFGLCSFYDPQQVLNEMVRVCKPNGMLLLLEHGRSDTWPLVTRQLDRKATQHAEQWGCWYNRDIAQMVGTLISQQQQDQPLLLSTDKTDDKKNTTSSRMALEVVESKVWHFGTTYYYVLRKPNPAPVVVLAAAQSPSLAGGDTSTPLLTQAAAT